jgi:hypothetical protein
LDEGRIVAVHLDDGRRVCPQASDLQGCARGGRRWICKAGGSRLAQQSGELVAGNAYRRAEGILEAQRIVDRDVIRREDVRGEALREACNGVFDRSEFSREGDDGGDEADVVEAQRAVGRECGRGRGRDEVREDRLHLLRDEGELRRRALREINPIEGDGLSASSCIAP